MRWLLSSSMARSATCSHTPMLARLSTLAALVLFACCVVSATAVAPNIVVFVADDVGYGDLGVYGHPSIETPTLDRLAGEGTRFTQWTSENSLCTPSRAAMLTGRLSVRSGMTHEFVRVMHSTAQSTGLPRSEQTLATLLKPRGYTSALIGKWHLGCNQNTSDDGYFLPTAHGYDYWAGMPLTNIPGCNTSHPEAGDNLQCILMRGNQVVEQPVRLSTMPERLTREAVDFIGANRDRPFYLHYAFVQAHTPLFVSEGWRDGRSTRGAYGDAIYDIDFAVAEVVAYLDVAGVLNNTLIVFLSDNGAWLEEEIDSGSNGLLRGGKAQAWEGGMRVPAIVWGPSLGVQARVSRALVSSLDLVPTVLHFVTGSEPVFAYPVDGRSIQPILVGLEDDSVTGSERELPYFCGYILHAVRLGPWKALFRTPRVNDTIGTGTCVYRPGRDLSGCSCNEEANDQYDPPLLYQLDRDPSEKYPVRSTDPQYQDILAKAYAARVRYSLVETMPSQTATPADPALQPCCNPPECRCMEAFAPRLPSTSL